MKCPAGRQVSEVHSSSGCCDEAGVLSHIVLIIHQEIVYCAPMSHVSLNPGPHDHPSPLIG